MRQFRRRNNAVSTVVSTLVALSILVSSVGVSLMFALPYLNDQQSKEMQKEVGMQFESALSTFDELSDSEIGDTTQIPVSTSGGYLDTKYSYSTTFDKPINNGGYNPSSTDSNRNVISYSTRPGFNFTVDGLTDSDNKFTVNMIQGSLKDATAYWLKENEPPVIIDCSKDVSLVVKENVTLWVNATDDYRVVNATITIDGGQPFEMTGTPSAKSNWTYNFTAWSERNHNYVVTVYDDSRFSDSSGPWNITVIPPPTATVYSRNMTVNFINYTQMLAQDFTITATPGDDISAIDHATVVFEQGGRTEVPMIWHSGGGGPLFTSIPHWYFSYQKPPDKPPFAAIDFKDIDISGGSGAVKIYVLNNDYDNDTQGINASTLAIVPKGGGGKGGGQGPYHGSVEIRYDDPSGEPFISYTAKDWGNPGPFSITTINYDSFNYTVSDTMGAKSNEATVYVYRRGTFDQLAATLPYTLSGGAVGPGGATSPIIANADFYFINNTLRSTGISMNRDFDQYLLGNDIDKRFPSGTLVRINPVAFPRYSTMVWGAAAVNHISFTNNFGPDVFTYSAISESPAGVSLPGPVFLAGDEKYHINLYDSNNNIIGHSDTYTIHYNRKPVADAGGPYTGMQYENIEFDGSGSYDPDGTIVSYYWDFGDGHGGTGKNPAHIYTSYGTFTVSLTVKDDHNAYATDTAPVTVEQVTTPPVYQGYVDFKAYCAGYSFHAGSGPGEWDLSFCGVDADNCIGDFGYTMLLQAMIIDSQNVWSSFNLYWYADDVLFDTTLNCPDYTWISNINYETCVTGKHTLSVRTGGGHTLYSFDLKINFIKGVGCKIFLPSSNPDAVDKWAGSVKIGLSWNPADGRYHWALATCIVTFEAEGFCGSGNYEWTWHFPDDDGTWAFTKSVRHVFDTYGHSDGDTFTITCEIYDVETGMYGSDTFELLIDYNNAVVITPKIYTYDAKPPAPSRYLTFAMTTTRIGELFGECPWAAVVCRPYYNNHPNSDGNCGVPFTYYDGSSGEQQSDIIPDTVNGQPISHCEYTDAWTCVPAPSFYPMRILTQLQINLYHEGFNGAEYMIPCDDTWAYYKFYGWEECDYPDATAFQIDVTIKCIEDNGFLPNKPDGTRFEGSDHIHVYVYPSSSFLTGTPVLLADGSHKNIEDIKPGDRVQSYDVENKELKSGEVTQLFYYPSKDIIYDYYLVLNGVLRVTPNHMFYLNNGRWVEAGDLQIGDVLFNKDLKENYKVISIEKVYEKQSVYDLSVEQYHNFFVSINGVDVLVHNAGSYDEPAPPDTHRAEDITITPRGVKVYDLNSTIEWPFSGRVVIYLKDGDGIFGKIWIFDYDRPAYITSDNSKEVTMINDAVLYTDAQSIYSKSLSKMIEDGDEVLSLKIIQTEAASSFSTGGSVDIKIEAQIHGKHIREMSRKVYNLSWKIVDEQAFTDALKTYYTTQYNFKELSSQVGTLFYLGSDKGIDLSFSHSIIRFSYQY